MMRFEYISDSTKVSMEFEEHDIVDVLENFENFLRGCGYYFDGIVVAQIPKTTIKKSEEQLLLE